MPSPIASQNHAVVLLAALAILLGGGLALTGSAHALARTAARPPRHEMCMTVRGHGRVVVVCRAPAVRHRPMMRRVRTPARPTPLHLAQVIQTTVNLKDALTVKPPGVFAAAPAAGATILHVNDQVRYQRITGFGAAMTDSSAWLLYDELTPPARDQAFRALFGAGGIHLDYVRIQMGASDYTATKSAYSYDDMPPGQTDPTMAAFSVGHDEPYIIPALQEMLRINPDVFTLANPWSAPPWMKANQSYNNANLAGVVDPANYPALAQYFVKFIQAYQAHGVPIDAITMMNEPGSKSGWPGTALSPDDVATFLPQDLAPALASAGLHPTVYGLDDTELADAQALLSGSAAADLGGIAFHCYAGLGQMGVLHGEYPNEPLLVNECSPGIVPFSTAEVSIDATNNGASGAQLWNLALDPSGAPFEGDRSWGCPGCTGVVTVDETTHEFAPNLNYFQLGQMSKYVMPGAVRISSTRLVTDGYGISHGVDDAAFVNPDGSRVLVAYNNSSATRSFAIGWHGTYLSYRLAPAATVTFLWR